MIPRFLRAIGPTLPHAALALLLALIVAAFIPAK